ncbi:MAG: hypothetical protein K8S97_12185 [Anaerolineae bacterium]|nr:hypothetical protein [Anaerolineae bacterium]
MTTPDTVPTPARRLACLGRILAPLFGLLFAITLIEIGGRVALGFAPLPGWAQDFNAHVGYELRPDEEYTYASTNGEFETRVVHNNRGLHDVDHTLAKPDNTFRVLILSDSYGQAREVPLEQNFARQLETLLNTSAPEGITVEVINAGYFGLGTTQEYLYYIKEGRRYDPDLVLLGFYVGNDVVDNHAPLIQAWNDVAKVDFPYLDTDDTLHQPGLSTQRRALSWLRHNVYLVSAISDAVAGTGTPDRVEVGDPHDITARALRVPMGVYLPPDATWSEAWAVTDLALARLHAVVTEDGAQFAVFVIPDRRQLYDADWNATLAQLPDLDPAQLDRERPMRAIMTQLEAHAIPALNLLDVFRPSSARLYFPIDGHFTPEGHTLTAQTLAAWLTDTGLLLPPED